MIRSYLAASGWSVPEFTKRTGLHKSMVSMLFAGKRGAGPKAALAIEAATVDAWRRGDTTAMPLRVAELLSAKREAA